MIKANSIIIQNVIYPYFVAVKMSSRRADAEGWRIKFINRNFNTVIDELHRQIDMSSLQRGFINIGPGSYTGIRQGVSFALGLAVTKENIEIFQFTSFDLVSFVAKEERTNIFVQGLPPIEIAFKSKGFGSNKLSSRALIKGWLGTRQAKGWNVVYSNLDSIPEDTLVYGNSLYTSVQFQWVEPSSLCIDGAFLEKFVNYLLDKRRAVLIEDIGEIAPLYVNPVNITS